jgi:tRNA dimethylallyltransferase
MAQHRLMIIIYGPTGVGKTDFGLELARKLSGEIINADVGQFYVPIAIGTAKPDWKSSTIPHHFFDVINTANDFTVSEYRKELLIIAQEIWHRHHMPIIIGGSGFYISSIFFPPESNLESVPMGKETNDYDQGSWQDLYAIDPQRAFEIHPHDAYRIRRAIELWKKTGKKPSEYKPVYKPPSSCLLIYLQRDRDELYRRINERVILMINQGWIEEVEHIRGTPWEKFLQQKKLIGYDDILKYLEQNPEKRDKKKLIETIACKTRNYAKRQMIFWKMLEKKICAIHSDDKHQVIIETLNLTSCDLDVYINRLVKMVTTLKEGKHV